MAMPEFVKSRARKAVLPVGLVGGLALLFAWMLNHLGAGVGSGSGPGRPEANSPTAATATQPAGPVEVVIRGDGYWVGQQNMTIEQIVAAASAGGAVTPAVRIVSGPDSRMGAETDLAKALDQAHLAYEVDANPVAQP